MSTYSDDYAGWAEDTALAIAEGRFDEIDREALADEVLDLSKRARSEIESALRVVLLHMLKAKYHPLRHTRSWDLTMHRQRLSQSFEESPSLYAQRERLLGRAYPLARIRAANETGLHVAVFPGACEWSVAEVLGE